MAVFTNLSDAREGKMKNRMNKFKSLLLIMLCVILVVPCLARMDASAATTRQRAIAAYKKWLSAPKIRVAAKGTRYFDIQTYESRTYYDTRSGNVKFALANIDSDGIPELILYTKVGWNSIYGILTYKNGRIYRVYSYAGDGKLMGYYKGTGYFFMRTYSDGTPFTDSYYRIYGAKIRRNFTKFDYGYGGEADYTVGKTDVSRSTFVSKIRRAVQYKKKTNPTYYTNTSGNRSAHLR